MLGFCPDAAIAVSLFQAYCHRHLAAVLEEASVGIGNIESLTRFFDLRIEPLTQDSPANRVDIRGQKLERICRKPVCKPAEVGMPLAGRYCDERPPVRCKWAGPESLMVP